MDAVEVQEVFRVFRTPEGDAPALQGVSLTIAPGEVVAIIGPSGSGKSSLLRMLAGLDHPDAGSVRVLGRRPSRMSDRRLTDFRRRHLGLVEQHAEDSISPDARCRDAVALQARLLGRPRAAASEAADAMLDRVGLGDVADRRTRTLSGGQRQRVAVAAAMAHRPGLLLADEPTGELDTASARAVHEAIRALVDDAGATAVIVSHDDAVAAIADRVLLIADGRLATERASGRDTPSLVVSSGGWLQLPADVCQMAGLAERATVSVERDAVVLRATGTGDLSSRSAPLETARRTPGQPAVVLERIGVDFGAGPVITAVDATFAAGAMTALTGPSGAGKTTMLQLIAGLLTPTTGRCVVAGVDVAALDADARTELRRRLVAVVEQDVGLVPYLTARENVAFGQRLRGGDAEAAEDWLIRLELTRRLDQRVSRLSAGERQRVAIARALAARPTVLLVDEPTSRLDAANAELVARLLVEVTHELGTCTIAATHDPLVIAQADRRYALAAPR